MSENGWQLVSIPAHQLRGPTDEGELVRKGHVLFHKQEWLRVTSLEHDELRRVICGWGAVLWEGERQRMQAGSRQFEFQVDEQVQVRAELES